MKMNAKKLVILGLLVSNCYLGQMDRVPKIPFDGRDLSETGSTVLVRSYWGMLPAAHGFASATSG